MSSTPQEVCPTPKSWKRPIEYDPNKTIAYALPAPPGYVKQAIYEPSRASEIRIASVITIAACFVIVVARLVSKFAITRTPGWEDCKWNKREHFAKRVANQPYDALCGILETSVMTVRSY